MPACGAGAARRPEPGGARGPGDEEDVIRAPVGKIAEFWVGEAPVEHGLVDDDVGRQARDEGLRPAHHVVDIAAALELAELGDDVGHCPGMEANGGWLDLDPTNDLVPAIDHVTLAYGRDYGDVTPLRGVIRGGGGHELSVHVTVMPWDEAPAQLDLPR